MPLLDHIHPPLSERRHWHSFHNSWATYISSQLNASLPECFFAEANVQFGVEIDAAAIDESAFPPVITLPLTIARPVVEIGVFSRSGGPRLAGAIELVSPANKDRPSHREAFVTKCASYIQAGVGLVVVDVVTERRAGLHRELCLRLGSADIGDDPELSASAYRPLVREGTPALDVWLEPLALGRPLPIMPLWLLGGFCLPVELEAT